MIPPREERESKVGALVAIVLVAGLPLLAAGAILFLTFMTTARALVSAAALWAALSLLLAGGTLLTRRDLRGSFLRGVSCALLGLGVLWFLAAVAGRLLALLSGRLPLP